MSIEHYVEQGTAEWFALRIGIPTASEFVRVVQPSTGQLSRNKAKTGLSEKAHAYAVYLVTEMLLNRPLETIEGVHWMERGKELEPAAAKLYEFSEGVKTRKVGFVTTDDKRMGASPDRLIVGTKGGIELKCPAPHTHVGYLLDGFGEDYVPQVQGQILVCELDYVDRYSYHPEMPPAKVRTYRDEIYCNSMAAALREFCDIKDAMFQKAKAAGWYVEREQVLTPHQIAYSDDEEVERLVAGMGAHHVMSG